MENVSLVKSGLMPGFSLRGTLGEPREAAEKLLSTVIAPPDSGKCFLHDFHSPCGALDGPPTPPRWIVFFFPLRPTQAKARGTVHYMPTAVFVPTRHRQTPANLSTVTEL